MIQIKPPWSDEQVKALNEYQHRGQFHPFTCPNRQDGKHPDHPVDKGLLTATTAGWVCEACGYTQDWAHEFMFKPIPLATGTMILNKELLAFSGVHRWEVLAAAASALRANKVPDGSSVHIVVKDPLIPEPTAYFLTMVGDAVVASLGTIKPRVFR